MNRLKIGLLCALIGGMTAIGLHRQKGNEQLTAEIETLRRQNSELPVLQADHRRLTTAASDRAEAARGKREERERLMAEIAALRNEVETRQRKRAAAAAQSRPNNNPAPAPVSPPGTLLVESMQNVGRATPALAMETGFWAQNRGDVRMILDGLAFDSEVKAKLDALWAELSPAEQRHFESPERLAAILVAGTTPKRGGGPGTPVRIVEMSQSAETAELALRVPLPTGEFKDVKTVKFRRDADGWKAALPVGDMELLAALFHGLPPSQRLRLGGK